MMDKKIRVAINGFGRIGRAFLRVVLATEANQQIEIVAINDLGEMANLAYLLKYDSAYGLFEWPLDILENKLRIADQEILFLQEKNPELLPWQDLGIDIVIEATGHFEDYSAAAKHLSAGAKRVIISAPAKGQVPAEFKGGMVLLGVNDELLQDYQISSNASCTTNAISPALTILDEEIGLTKAILNTIHAYTASQKVVDSPDSGDWRRGRAAASNLIPSTTGAAKALGKIMPNFENNFDGLAVRVPVITGSLVDLTFVTKRPTSVEEINNILSKQSENDRWQDLISVTNEPLVSTDIINTWQAGIVDLSFTKVIADDLVKILIWYDNEMGYAHTLVKHLLLSAKYI